MMKLATVSMGIDEPRSAAQKARSFEGVREMSTHCQGCVLFRHARQIVFGEGRAPAKIMMVGEQPADEDELEGRPFAGEEGRTLDELIEEAGIDRANVYVTHAVKHAKREPSREGQRLPPKPAYAEVQACLGWLEAEIRWVRPRAIVCFGATAAQAFHGRSFRLAKHRGEIQKTVWAPAWMVTHHPGLLLRAPDEERRLAVRRELVEDLKKLANALAKPRARA